MCVYSLTILSCFAFNSAFVANVASFLFKSEFYARLEILDSFYLCIKNSTQKFIIIRSGELFSFKDVILAS